MKRKIIETPSSFKRETERKKDIIISPPVVDQFFEASKSSENPLVKLAFANPEFRKELELRKRLVTELNVLKKQIPDATMNVDEALEKKLISPTQLAKFYTDLSDFLELDPNHARLILYLPFEILPNESKRSTNKKLQQATDRFNVAYRTAWKSLRDTHDVRANFVDGDVLEVSHRTQDLPRVVKAAHLIPKLVESGLMNVTDIITLIERSDDQILKKSIADTIPVLADLGFISETEIEQMETSTDQLVNDMARVITSNVTTKEQQFETKAKMITLSSVQEEVDRQFNLIEQQEYGAITKNRKQWLISKQKQEVIEQLGKSINAAIMNNSFTTEEVTNFLSLKLDTTSQCVLIEGIRSAIESTAVNNPKRARAVYANYKHALLTLWQQNRTETSESLSRTFRRLRHLNIVDDKLLAKLNIDIPKLAGPFSENAKFMKEEMREIRDATATIKSNPELSKYIYPVALISGSRVKGYGTRDKDIDVCVFVRPGTLFSERAKLTSSLERLFIRNKVKGPIIEFWLEEQNNNLTVHDFPSPDVSLGESYLTGNLFGGAWIGENKAIKELHEKLLLPYTIDTKKVTHGRDAQGLYLEELERDNLQYRLMHTGYERFFPPQGGIHTPHSDEIDGRSTFYDTGFRYLASELFFKRVFLPKVPTPKK